MRATAAGTTPDATPGRPACTTARTGPSAAGPVPHQDDRHTVRHHHGQGLPEGDHGVSGGGGGVSAGASGPCRPPPRRRCRRPRCRGPGSCTGRAGRPSPSAGFEVARAGAGPPAGSSPTWSARLPAAASVKATHTPGRTSARHENTQNPRSLPNLFAELRSYEKAPWHCHPAVPWCFRIYLRKSGTSRSSEWRPDRSGSTTDGRSTSKPESAGTADGRCWPQPP